MPRATAPRPRPKAGTTYWHEQPAVPQAQRAASAMPQSTALSASTSTAQAHADASHGPAASTPRSSSVATGAAASAAAAQTAQMAQSHGAPSSSAVATPGAQQAPFSTADAKAIFGEPQASTLGATQPRRSPAQAMQAQSKAIATGALGGPSTSAPYAGAPPPVPLQGDGATEADRFIAGLMSGGYGAATASTTSATQLQRTPGRQPATTPTGAPLLPEQQQPFVIPPPSPIATDDDGDAEMGDEKDAEGEDDDEQDGEEEEGNEEDAEGEDDDGEGEDEDESMDDSTRTDAERSQASTLRHASESEAMQPAASAPAPQLCAAAPPAPAAASTQPVASVPAPRLGTVASRLQPKQPTAKPRPSKRVAVASADSTPAPDAAPGSAVAAVPITAPRIPAALPESVTDVLNLRRLLRLACQIPRDGEGSQGLDDFLRTVTQLDDEGLLDDLNGPQKREPAGVHKRAKLALFKLVEVGFRVAFDHSARKEDELDSTEMAVDRIREVGEDALKALQEFL
ncbi:hypothetical protein FA09DRAFT_331280 [Tilletiopsis washingtonensis]|uniref:Uncharacterized protein n=1 Tax=Tilletiopsis washingtonensis TaxID=58919 RepID=A0A316Z4V0_9BASI|nr:hypothetical protein FA09DRAFT_331280 [Tilletiopsis washingtonensis]PWN96386.1 hypothetical protein FA09DRAFT_331280 [Tilletiopsis washingtonensis]